jgi:hypothetical protein
VSEFQRLQERIAALAGEVGEKARVCLTIESGRLYASIYTRGIAADTDDPGAFSVFEYGAHPFAVLDDLRNSWLAEKDKRSGRIAERMALEIIRLTAEFGECTDAALRAEFGAATFAEMASIAVERANKMAANGPFTIKATALANAA